VPLASLAASARVSSDTPFFPEYLATRRLVGDGLDGRAV